MSDESARTEPKASGKVAPETLELRGRPQPITRINRKVLIGGAAVVLLVISGLVLVALRPPAWRTANPLELYNVDRKPIADGLGQLPSSYDGVRTQAPGEPKVPAGASGLPTGVRQLTTPTTDTASEAEKAEKSRLARMASQAREAPLFFRQQLKAAPRETAPSVLPRAAPEPVARPALMDGGLESLRVQRAADRARALSGTDVDPLANDATDQTRKLSFLRSGPEKEIYNPHALQTPASPYQVMAGTVIAASLVSGLSSDLPGFVIAQVTEHVYDTVSGRHLLIPQGSRLVGKYDSVVAFGQQRALVVWQRIILPDGSSIVIDNLPATDTGGYAGLADEVDLHTWKLLKGIALSTLLGIGNQLAFGSTDSDLVKALRESTGQTTNRAGQRMVERSLNVQPTITVRPGWPLRIIVHKDLVMRAYRGPASVPLTTKE